MLKNSNPAKNACMKRFYNRRTEMVWMLFSGISLVYCLRVNISVAAQSMRDEFNWSETQKGLVLSSFYWGYVLGLIPSSFLIMYTGGAKWIFGLSVILPTILTILFPFACRISFPLTLFVRVLIGLSESATFPSVYYFYTQWIPSQEKTLLIPAVNSGMYFGEIIGFSLSGFLVKTPVMWGKLPIGSWPSVFYVFGLLGVIWFPYWALKAYDSPEKHPGITKEEIDLIKQNSDMELMKRKLTIEKNIESKQYIRLPSSQSMDVSQSPLFEAESSEKILEYEELDNDIELSPISLEGKKKSQVLIRHHTSQNKLLNHEDESPLSTRYQTHNHSKYSIVSSTDEIDQDLIINEEKPKDITHKLDLIHVIKSIPWRIFLTNPISLTVLLNNWTFGYICFTLLSELPSYLTDCLGFDISIAGLLCLASYFTLFIFTLFFGYMFDYLQLHHNWSTTLVRQVSHTISYFGSTLCLLCSSLSPTTSLALFFLIFAQVFLAAGQGSIYCIYMDITPRYSAILNTLGNTMSAMAGIVGPILTSIFLDIYPGVGGWRLLFLSCFSTALLSLVLWLTYVKATPIPELN